MRTACTGQFLTGARALCGLVCTALAGLTACGGVLNVPAAQVVASAELSVSSVSFGQVTVGTQASEHIILSSDGSTALSSIALSLSDTTNFSETNNCGVSLLAGSTCTVTVTFQPTSAANISGFLSVRDDAGNSPQVVALQGTGTAAPMPQATLLPASLLFGSVTVGAASAALPVKLTNTGSAPLTLSGMNLSDTTDFSLTSTCGTSLPVAASCDVAVTFKPQTGTAYAATLTLTDNAGGVAGSTQTVSLTGNGRFPVSSVTNFGDSITCGAFASPLNGTGYVFSTYGYAGLFDAALGVPALNLCRSGDEAADTARLWAENVTPALGQGQLFTLMLGTNDAYQCGNSSGCMANYQYAFTATLAWLALPASDKYSAGNITTRSGSWTTDLNDSLTSLTKNSTLDFTVQQTVAGRPLLLAYQAIDASLLTGGSANVFIDGVAAATLTTTPSTGHPIATGNGTLATTFLAQLPLGSVGSHNIHIQVTSNDGALWSLMWAGVSTGNYAAVDGAPRVLVGSITTTESAALNATVAQYNTLLSSLVSGLAAQGLNIQVAPTATALDPATDLTDLVHPNNGGHAKLAAAFQSVF
jgi:lysophospholipase L1-like esterase